MIGRRVVVTGLGLISPFGIGVELFWKGVSAGHSAVRSIERFDTANLPVRFGGVIPSFDPLDFIDRREARRMSFLVQLAVAATRLALRQAEESAPLAADPTRVGAVLGATVSYMNGPEAWPTPGEDRPRRSGAQDPFYIARSGPHMGACAVAASCGAKGPVLSTYAACATGNQAIGEGAYLIARDDVDVVFAGASDSLISPFALTNLAIVGALSRRNDCPEVASRPFDRTRDGFVAGEGAGVLVLESLDHAQNRGAHILAEVVGFGSTCDAYHVTAPEPTGEGAARAMSGALRSAGLDHASIDYINAHGTGTPLNDAVETRAIKRVFGERAQSIPISSTKSIIGHLSGAAGAVEAIACVCAMRNGFIPPTINYTTADPECDLDYVPNVGRPAEINLCLSNAFGMGGQNACLVFRRWSSAS